MAPNPLVFYDLAQTVLQCICETMNSIDLPGYACPCRSYVSPGPPAFDNCCDWECEGGESHGQLTVHIEDVFPTINFPARAQPIHPCAPGVQVAQMLVTAVRCAPTLDEAGNAPPPEAIERTSRIIYTDLWATIQALSCCVPHEDVKGKRRRRVVVANAGASGAGGITAPEGGCAAVTVRAWVEAGNVCGCEVTS